LSYPRAAGHKGQSYRGGKTPMNADGRFSDAGFRFTFLYRLGDVCFTFARFASRETDEGQEFSIGNHQSKIGNSRTLS
jgi:hypothetical protein